ncbi:MAG: hypothetical protein Q9209_003115 [Squamulea sp. 1 TL-2023]
MDMDTRKIEGLPTKDFEPMDPAIEQSDEVVVNTTDIFDMNVGTIGEDNDLRIPDTVRKTFKELCNAHSGTDISTGELKAVSDSKPMAITAQTLCWAPDLEQGTSAEADAMDNNSIDILAYTEDDIYAAPEGSSEDKEMNSYASMPDVSGVDTDSDADHVPGISNSDMRITHTSTDPTESIYVRTTSYTDSSTNMLDQGFKES